VVPSKGSRTPCPMKNPTRVRHVGDFLSAQEGSCTEDGVLVLQQPGLSPPAHGEGDNHVDLVTYHNPCVHSDSCDPNSNLAPSEPHDEYAAQRRLLFGLGAPAGFEPAPLGLGMVVSNKMCIEPDVLFWLVFNDRTLSYFALASRSARTVVVVYRRTMRCSCGCGGLLHRGKTPFGHAQAHAQHLPCSPGPAATIGVHRLPVPTGGDRARSALVSLLWTFVS